METIRYSAAAQGASGANNPAGGAPLRPEGRLIRILLAVENGPLSTTEVYDAARNPASDRPHREAGKTRGALMTLQARDLIRWANNVVSLSDSGREALADTMARRAA